jgi:transcriptional regulator with XRE-family HTH domain
MSKNSDFGHEAMSKHPRLIDEREVEFEGQDLHEFLSRDVNRWIGENIAAHGDKVSREALYERLADKIGVTSRQIRRYLDGATEVSVRKAINICKELGLKGIFEFANYELGLDTCEVPVIPASECDDYDAAEVLVKNIKAFSHQAVILSKSLNAKPSTVMLQKIRNAGLEARKRILQCERLYQEMLKQRALADYHRKTDTRNKRIKKAREALKKAGQGGLFE